MGCGASIESPEPAPRVKIGTENPTRPADRPKGYLSQDPASLEHYEQLLMEAGVDVLDEDMSAESIRVVFRRTSSSEGLRPSIRSSICQSPATSEAIVDVHIDSPMYSTCGNAQCGTPGATMRGSVSYADTDIVPLVMTSPAALCPTSPTASQRREGNDMPPADCVTPKASYGAANESLKGGVMDRSDVSSTTGTPPFRASRLGSVDLGTPPFAAKMRAVKFSNETTIIPPVIRSRFPQYYENYSTPPTTP